MYLEALLDIPICENLSGVAMKFFKKIFEDISPFC